MKTLGCLVCVCCLNVYFDCFSHYLMQVTAAVKTFSTPLYKSFLFFFSSIYLSTVKYLQMKILSCDQKMQDMQCHMGAGHVFF